MSAAAFLGAIVLSLYASQAPAVPSKCREDRTWSTIGWYQKLYDPGTLTTVRGRVASIEDFFLDSCAAKGVLVRVKTEDGLVSVHLGPDWYLRSQRIVLVLGEEISSMGSTATYAGRTFHISAVLVRERSVDLLRHDDDGSPLWSGGQCVGRPLDWS